MTYEEVARTLRHMEHLRLSSYEAETRAEERRLTTEYGRLWKSIRPYVEGELQFDPPISSATVKMSHEIYADFRHAER